jgi:hypothetical protein
VFPDAQRVAIIVRVGFTAPIEGKKLESTTQRLSRSCALQLTSRTDVVGSVRKRAVPAWSRYVSSEIDTDVEDLNTQIKSAARKATAERDGNESGV